MHCTNLNDIIPLGECYNFMSVDVGAYLPSYDQTTIYFLKDLMKSKKKSKYQ